MVETIVLVLWPLLVAPVAEPVAVLTLLVTEPVLALLVAVLTLLVAEPVARDVAGAELAGVVAAVLLAAVLEAGTLVTAVPLLTGTVRVQGQLVIVKVVAYDRTNVRRVV